MKKREYKTRLFELLDQDVAGMEPEEKPALVEQLRLEYQEKQRDGLTPPNRGKRWRDAELRVVLRSAPMRENCLLFAKLFGRSHDSIELIYRRASTAGQDIPEDRENDRFLQQVKRIAKEAGWRAG